MTLLLCDCDTLQALPYKLIEGYTLEHVSTTYAATMEEMQMLM